MKEIRQLVLQWARSYPGLWLSPMGLIVLGSWMWSQPSSTIQPARSEENQPEVTLQASQTEAAESRSELAASQPKEDPAEESSSAEPSNLSGSSNLSESSNSTESSSGVLITQAAEFDASSPSHYQERPTEAEVRGEPEPEAEALSPTETLASAARQDIESSPPAQLETGKTDAELADDPDLIAAAAPQVGPSDAEIAAAKTAQQTLEQQLAATNAAQQAAPVAASPAPNVVNGGDPAVDQAIVMQVAIAEGDVNLSMGVSNGGVLYIPQGQAIAQLTAGSHSMACDGENLILNGQQSLPSTVMMAPVEGGINYVRDRSYRGHIQFFCQGDTVLAVNHIDMLHYLYSVVGSEVSGSWPLASLKAQAVAARSYALTYYFRPAKEHFHIGDSESYQVYKGTATEHSRVIQAVHETAGEFISYGGGIVESLYAASDEIVQEAFQGGGMSQLGARDLSEQGYNYLQILGYYYPETSLGRLALDLGE